MKPKRKIEPWLFLLPALVVYVSIVLFPMLQTIGYSFMDWNGIGEKTFAGLKITAECCQIKICELLF